ncbi:hypothetical protein ACT3CE_14745 [Marinifilum sp. RC60d5]|uniref:hypothetical protein n=1 Tax=Marinifilum sp. RC60d5 TaxID=3458414 RepID=UPI004036C347
MKRKITTLLLFFVILCLTQQTNAQYSVRDAIKYASRLKKKVKKGNFKKFNKSYAEALQAIEKIESKATSTEFGYDGVASNINSWIKLNNILAKFPNGKIVYKDESIDLKVKDYGPLKVEAKTKAAQAHFDAGIKIVNESDNFIKRKKAFTHFSKVEKYALNYKETYAEKVKEEKGKVYYEEAMRLLSEGKTFEEKKKAVSLFTSTKKVTDSYKDIDEKVAGLYYDEAIRLSASDKIKDLSAATGYFATANKWISDFNGCVAKRDEVCEKGAGIVYDMAVEKEKEKSFSAQSKAAEIFENANKWVKDYKDATARAKIARDRSKVNVLVVDKNGNLLSPSAFAYGLKQKLPNYFITPSSIKDAANIDMNNTDNYAEAKKVLGYGFVVVKIGEPESIEYSKSGPTSSMKDVHSYYVKKKNASTGKIETKKISESTYKTTKAIIAIAKEDGGQTLLKYSGKVSTTVESATAIATYALEIWDARDAENPVRVGVIYKKYSKTDRIVREVYAGDGMANPGNLSNPTRSLKTEAELKASLSSNPPSVKELVKLDVDKVAEKIKLNIFYK